MDRKTLTPTAETKKGSTFVSEIEGKLVPIPAGVLDWLETARRALVEAKDLPEVKDIRDKVLAIQTYLHQQQCSLAALNIVAELKLRAERRLGQLLAETIEHGGDRKSESRLLRSWDRDFVTELPNGNKLWKRPLQAYSQSLGNDLVDGASSCCEEDPTARPPPTLPKRRMCVGHTLVASWRRQPGLGLWFGRGRRRWILGWNSFRDFFTAARFEDEHTWLLGEWYDGRKWLVTRGLWRVTFCR
jgi:hypothetical protein